MRKFALLSTLLVLSLVLASCSFSTIIPKNEIAPKELTKDQQKIVSLLNQKAEILFFDYNTIEKYKNFDVWVEVYKDGKLVSPHAAQFSMRGDGEKTWNGELAIVITHVPDFMWTITSRDGASSTSVESEPSPYYGTNARAYGPINEPVEIIADKGIILYTSVFSNKDTMAAYGAQEYEERPELLKEYDYAHIIKCRFSNQP